MKPFFSKNIILPNILAYHLIYPLHRVTQITRNYFLTYFVNGSAFLKNQPPPLKKTPPKYQNLNKATNKQTNKIETQNNSTIPSSDSESHSGEGWKYF